MLRKKRYHRVHSPVTPMGVHPVFIDFHRLDMRSDKEYPQHRHTDYEAILVERGPYLCELNGIDLSVRAGNVLVIKPGDWHADHLRRGQRHYVLHFRVESGSAAPARPLFRTDVEPTGQIARGQFRDDAILLQEIRREAERESPYSAAVQDSLIAALFWRWVGCLNPDGLSREWLALPAAESRRGEIEKILTRHVRGNPSVAELAREAGVSRRQFTAQCQALLGGPPARLLLELKLREAEAMLRHQGKRVNEVSEELGFANPFHFSRVCRRFWGHPPQTLRCG